MASIFRVVPSTVAGFIVCPARADDIPLPGLAYLLLLQDEIRGKTPHLYEVIMSYRMSHSGSVSAPLLSVRGARGLVRSSNCSLAVGVTWTKIAAGEIVLIIAREPGIPARCQTALR